MIEHTATCLRAQEKRRQQQVAWREKWPDHCPHCEGNTNCGDPCEYCLLGLRCPRCGKEDAMDEYDATIPCKYCGYMEDQGCPPNYVCKCRVAKAEAKERERGALERQREEIERRLAALR